MKTRGKKKSRILPWMIAGVIGSVAATVLYQNRPMKPNQFPAPTIQQLPPEEAAPPETSLRFAGAEDIQNLRPYLTGVECQEGINPDRALYYIFQTHHSATDLRLSAEGVTSQVRVYRLLDYLAKRNFIDVVALEGLRVGDSSFEAQVREVCPTLQVNPDDSELERLLQGKPLFSKFYVKCANPTVRVTGWEDTESTEDLSTTLMAYRKLGKGDKARDYFRSILHDRSRVSFLNSIEVADQLYSRGEIETKNTAVVIGTGHLPDIYRYMKTKDLVDRFPHVCAFLTDNVGSSSQ